MNNSKTSIIDQRVKEEYKYGFVTDIESDTLPPGISEETIHFISEKKNEPSWLLDWRIKAYKKSAITLPPIVEYPVKEPIERIGRLELIKNHLEKKIALYSFHLETSLPHLNKNLKKYTYRILVKGVTND